MARLDEAALLAYAALVLYVGWRAGRGPRGAGDLLLAGRSLPAWAAFGSLLATELSAATFLGVPHAAYLGDWSYLELAFGALLGKAVLAAFVIPLYHRLGVVTVYGFLGRSLGPRVQRAAALSFAAGRSLASGARLFIAALAFAVVTGVPVELAIVALGAVAGVYTRFGGLRAVVATDVLQAALFLAAAGAAIAVLEQRVPGGWGEILAWADAGGRTRVLHLEPLLSWASARPFGVGLVGGCVLTLATHATDHDMVQRLLATRDGRAGARALFATALANFPVTLLFLALGTGLARFYLDAPGYEVSDAARIVPIFALHELAPGLRGLFFAGLAAAAMSSLDSAVCAIAATWVVDVAPRDEDDASLAARTRRASVVACAVLIACGLAVAAYHAAVVGAPSGGPSLVELALSTMTVLYGGLLGVFAVAMLAPERATERGALAGLAAGALAGLALFLHPILWGDTVIAWPWWIPISCAVAVGVIFAVSAGGRNMRFCSR